MSTSTKSAAVELQELPSREDMRRPTLNRGETLGFADGRAPEHAAAPPNGGNQMHNSAFYADNRQSTAKTTLAFSVLFHSSADEIRLVTSSISSSLTPSEAKVFKTLNFTHSSPLALKIVGAHVPSWAKFSSLLVSDSSKTPKPLHPSVVWRSSKSDRAVPSGFPLFWASSQPIITRETTKQNVENLSFWGAELSDIKTGVRHIDAPNEQDSTVIFADSSIAAAACNYALSQKNQIIKPPLLENPQYRYSKDAKYIELARSQFNHVTSAFERKFAEVRASVFDLSVLTFELSDIPDARSARCVDVEGQEPLMLSLELTTLVGVNVKAQGKSSAAIEGSSFRTGAWSASDL
jgi:hypothetical protein